MYSTCFPAPLSRHLCIFFPCYTYYLVLPKNQPFIPFLHLDFCRVLQLRASLRLLHVYFLLVLPLLLSCNSAFCFSCTRARRRRRLYSVIRDLCCLPHYSIGRLLFSSPLLYLRGLHCVLFINYNVCTLCHSLPIPSAFFRVYPSKLAWLSLNYHSPFLIIFEHSLLVCAHVGSREEGGGHPSSIRGVLCKAWGPQGLGRWYTSILRYTVIFWPISFLPAHFLSYRPIFRYTVIYLGNSLANFDSTANFSAGILRYTVIYLGKSLANFVSTGHLRYFFGKSRFYRPIADLLC